MMIKLVQSKLNFSHREANGFIVILATMLVALLSPLIFEYFWKTQKFDDSKDQIMLEQLSAELRDIAAQGSGPQSKYNQKIHFQLLSDKSIVIHPFHFNPNEANKDDLLKLGLSPKVVNNILKFRAKKGIFKNKKDFAKIYGLDSTTYHQLKEYIQIPEYLSQPKSPKTNATFTKPIFSKIDINLADTTRLIPLKGIGSKLALRILKYRNKLGGFINSNQYTEVYGLDSSVISELKSKTYISNDFIPNKINLKNASLETLKKHPYLSPKEALVIINYIAQHPNFQIKDLHEIKILTSEKIEKITPYLTFKDPTQ